MPDNLGEVRRRGVGVGSADGGKEAQRVPLDGGLGVGGGIVETVKDHGNGVRRQRSDGLLEVLNRDLVRVAVGELGEGSEDPLLELHHSKVR